MSDAFLFCKYIAKGWKPNENELFKVVINCLSFIDLFGLLPIDNVYKVESTINKDDVIPDLPISGHYPETAAVKDYVDNKISGSNYLYRDLTNATSWDVLYNNNQNSI